MISSGSTSDLVSVTARASSLTVFLSARGFSFSAFLISAISIFCFSAGMTCICSMSAEMISSLSCLDMKSNAAMHRQNVSRMPQFLCSTLRSICFALARFEDEECGAMPRMAPISLCESPSRTESLNTLPYCSGSLSTASRSFSRGISVKCTVFSSIIGSGMLSKLVSGICCVFFRCWKAMFLTMEDIHCSSLDGSRRVSRRENMTMNES